MIRAFSLPIFVRQTAATVAGKAVWAMRNLGKYPLYVRRLYWGACFDGTPAASQSAYFLQHISVATPSGGTNMVVAAKNPADTSVPTALVSMVTYAQFLDTGLTDAGVVYGIPAGGVLSTVGCQRQVASAIAFDIDYETSNSRRLDSLIVPPLFGLAITLGLVAVIGDGIRGQIDWEEESGGP